MQKSATNSDRTNNKPKRRNEAWNYTPALPVGVSPYFQWPFNVVAVVKWVLGSWFPLSERLIILVIALLSWIYFHPSLETTREFSFDWISLIYFRNLALITLIAGGLYFYVLKCQGDEQRYDKRPFGTNKNAFTFRSQVLDNMFWSLASGVTIWSLYEILMLWAMANGYVPALSLPQDLVWLVVMIIFHLQYFTLSAVTTHTGYQGIRLGGKLILPLGTFHHQLHHRFFECNYGGLEVPIDQWVGSFHDGSADSHQNFLNQRRQRN